MFDILFFFKEKTAYEMRISDWSSDVCSSDLKPDSNPVALAESSRRKVLCDCVSPGDERRPGQPPCAVAQGIGFRTDGRMSCCHSVQGLVLPFAGGVVRPCRLRIVERQDRRLHRTPRVSDRISTSPVSDARRRWQIGRETCWDRVCKYGS